VGDKLRSYAGVIQLVECQLPKLDVAGSSPVARSLQSLDNSLFPNVFWTPIATRGRRSCVGHGSSHGSGNLWVRFEDEDVEPWVGVFESGGISPYCAVAGFDDDRDRAALVIAGGHGYIVDTATGTLMRRTPWFYSYGSAAAPFGGYPTQPDYYAMTERYLL
jgi:hypothetical protein